MRLLLDEHVDRVAAQQLRSRGFEALSVTEEEALLQSTDDELLSRAFADQRVIVTYDVADFRIAIDERSLRGESHFGVIYLSPRTFPQGRRYVGALVEAMHRLLTSMPGERDLFDRELWL